MSIKRSGTNNVLEKKEESKRLSFVVQKHRSSHLHYDFRLEMQGMLKSWAVPKGPSYDPYTKRLAMILEDHSLDYGKFEGVILDGNYGAGNVIVWDKGTYELLDKESNSGEIAATRIKRGGIKFRMFGKKLKGIWTLVKIGLLDDKSWLLIKDRDEYASNVDITQKDKSVISGLRVDEIDKQDMLESLR